MSNQSKDPLGQRCEQLVKASKEWDGTIVIVRAYKDKTGRPHVCMYADFEIKHPTELGGLLSAGAEMVWDMVPRPENGVLPGDEPDYADEDEAEDDEGFPDQGPQGQTV